MAIDAETAARGALDGRQGAFDAPSDVLDGKDGETTVKNTSDRLDRLAPVAQKLGVKVLANAITMGPYDVVTVMDAPDDATIAKVIGTVLSRGYVTTQTLRGFTADEFRQITADLG